MTSTPKLSAGTSAAVDETAAVAFEPAASKPRHESEVSIQRMVDLAEPGRRLLYQLIELCIYLGWPAAVLVTMIYLIGIPYYYAVPLTILLLTWPLLKIWLAQLLPGKDKDPRAKIRSSSFWFDGICFVGSPALRQIRRYSALSKSLDMIYNYFGRFGLMPEGLTDKWWTTLSPFPPINSIIRCWTTFWIGMPIAQDVRSRLHLVATMIEESTLKIHNDFARNGIIRPVQIVMLAGGTNQDLIMALSSLSEKAPEVQVEAICVEPDGIFSVKRSRQLMKHFGVSRESIRSIPRKVSTDPEKDQALRDVLSDAGYDFSRVDLVVCIGLGDYQYGDKLVRFLSMLDSGTNKIITANVSDNIVERPFLHTLIQWPKMQYLSMKAYLTIIRVAFPLRSIKITQTPHGIFNVAEVE